MYHVYVLVSGWFQNTVVFDEGPQVEPPSVLRYLQMTTSTSTSATYSTQETHDEMQLQSSLPVNQESNHGMRASTRQSRTTYRLRGIHESFDRVSLENALCIHFGIENNAIILHSLAHDIGLSSRRKVATVTFKTVPDKLEVRGMWTEKIPLPGKQELYDIIFDTMFKGFTPLTAAELEKSTTME